MIFSQEINELLIELQKQDEKMIKKYKETSNEEYFLTSVFINYITQDIEFLKNIEQDIKNLRYIYSILRVTLEQVIIYKFLMRRGANNHELCEDYLGFNINFDSMDTVNNSEHELLKALIGNRTTLYKNIFKKMAKEFEDVDKDSSIYSLYSIMADYVHNAYYECLKLDMAEEKYEDKMTNTIILMLLGEFLNTCKYIPRNKYKIKSVRLKNV